VSSERVVFPLARPSFPGSLSVSLRRLSRTVQAQPVLLIAKTKTRHHLRHSFVTLPPFLCNDHEISRHSHDFMIIRLSRLLTTIHFPDPTRGTWLLSIYPEADQSRSLRPKIRSSGVIHELVAGLDACGHVHVICGWTGNASVPLPSSLPLPAPSVSSGL
jgi:hypothetical protein